MRKRIIITSAIAGLSGGLLFGAGPAAAAHCTDSGAPGNSDFTAHVRANNAAGGHDEGDHRGWSSCEESSANFVE